MNTENKTESKKPLLFDIDAIEKLKQHNKETMQKIREENKMQGKM